jgi:hypothetical protein
VLDGSDLCCADDNRNVRDGDLHAGIRLNFPDWRDYGYLLYNCRAKLHLHGYGQRHAAAGGHVSGAYYSRD